MTDMQHWFQQALMKWFTYNKSKTSTYVLYVNRWRDKPQSKPIRKLCVENQYLPPETDTHIRINLEERLPELIRTLNNTRSPTVFTHKEKQFLMKYIITHKFKKKSTRNILTFMYGHNEGVFSQQRILSNQDLIMEEFQQIKDFEFSLVINKTKMGFILSDDPFTPIPTQLFITLSEPGFIDELREKKVEDVVLDLFDSVKSDIEKGNLTWVHDITYNWVLTPKLMLVLNKKSKKDTIDIMDPSTIIALNYINFASTLEFCISNSIENFTPVKRLLAFNEAQGDNLVELRNFVDEHIKKLKKTLPDSNSQRDSCYKPAQLLGSEFGLNETIEKINDVIKEISSQLEHGYLISNSTRANLELTLNFLKTLKEGIDSLILNGAKFHSEKEREQNQRNLILKLLAEWDLFQKSIL